MNQQIHLDHNNPVIDANDKILRIDDNTSLNSKDQGMYSNHNTQTNDLNNKMLGINKN